MAVTQQLARISSDQLATCQRDQKALIQLISFKAGLSDIYLDLDRAGEGLVAGLTRCGLPEVARPLNTLFGEGADIVGEALPALPPEHAVWSDITFVDQALVQQLALHLRALTPATLDAVLARAATLAAEQSLMRFDNARTYYKKAFTNLSDVLQMAARQNQIVVAWWD